MEMENVQNFKRIEELEKSTSKQNGQTTWDKKTESVRVFFIC